MKHGSLCQYGDCRSLHVGCTVVTGASRRRRTFCSPEHASLWLMRLAWLEGERDHAHHSVEAAFERFIQGMIEEMMTPRGIPN